VIYQIPNCPLVFVNDPTQRGRTEDHLMAQGWVEFLDDPDKNPEWLLRLPMVKAGFQAMRAAEEFLREQGIAEIEGHIVTGGSKRGWASWLAGAVDCPDCVNVIGIAPLVPIVPDFKEIIHS